MDRRAAHRGWLALQQYDQTVDSTAATPLRATRVWLRVDCDFLTEQAHFSYSTDGARWTPLGAPFTMAFQLKTFQGVRFALFHYNTGGARGGVADFDLMRRRRAEPARPDAADSVRPHDRAAGRGTRHALRRRRASADSPSSTADSGASRCAPATGSSPSRHSPTARARSRCAPAPPSDAETFQWMETLYGDLMLMSLATHRYLRLEPDGRVSSDSRGAEPDPNDGTALRWRRGGM